jgi:hypothetical protein
MTADQHGDSLEFRRITFTQKRLNVRPLPHRCSFKGWRPHCVGIRSLRISEQNAALGKAVPHSTVALLLLAASAQHAHRDLYDANSLRVVVIVARGVAVHGALRHVRSRGALGTYRVCANRSARAVGMAHRRRARRRRRIPREHRCIQHLATDHKDRAGERAGLHPYRLPCSRIRSRRCGSGLFSPRFESVSSATFSSAYRPPNLA